MRLKESKVTRLSGTWVVIAAILFLLGSCGNGGAPGVGGGAAKSFKASAKIAPEAAKVLELVGVEGQTRGPATWILVKVRVKEGADPSKTWINYKDSAGKVNSITTQAVSAGSVINVEIPCPDKGNPTGEIVSVTSEPINPP